MNRLKNALNELKLAGSDPHTKKAIQLISEYLNEIEPCGRKMLENLEAKGVWDLTASINLVKRIVGG